MSGHSKWNNIAKRKGANDAKKAKIFTKIGREMAIAIKEGGSANPDFNSRLRDCIAKAKANNMPNDNIKRTLDKYSGANGQVDYEANNYEGYGVGGVAVVVETLTDNKNRTVADVRHLFDKYGAGLGASGCVSWQFDKKGVIITIIIAFFILQAWWIYGSGAAYFTWMNAYGTILAPIAAIFIADYFIVKHKRADIASLFKGAEGRYWYSGGFNIAAIIAWVLAFIFPLLTYFGVQGSFWTFINSINYVWSFVVGFVVYILLMKTSLAGNSSVTEEEHEAFTERA